MKNLIRLAPLLALAPFAHAQEVDIEDASGYVAPLTINLVVSETSGGYAISPQKKTSDDAKGITYPDFSTFQTTYQPDTPLSTIVNPFGWETSAGNNYVEKVTTKNAGSDSPIVTAAGSFKLAKTRYTNATLLADLVAAGALDSAKGYRLVAVRFNVAGDSHYDTPTHTTDVNNSYYFFAEKGPKDPAPIYLGAERDDMFPQEDKFIAFSRSTTAKSGAYVDIFTGNPVENRYDYTLKSESYSGATLSDFTFFRPAAEERFYLLNAQGILKWSERYDARKMVMAPGGVNGALAGTAEVYTFAEGSGYVPTATNQALVGGSVKFGGSTYSESMIKYLDRMPPMSDEE